MPTPKAVETLIALAESQGSVISKDELMQKIRTDTIVEESNLAQYLHVLRKTLGETSDGKSYIETLKRRAYRFSGTVHGDRTHVRLHQLFVWIDDNLFVHTMAWMQAALAQNKFSIMPEYTIPAFKKGLELAVDTLDLDMVVTRDGKPVVSHEPWFSSAISLDKEGEPIPADKQRKYNIYEMTNAEVRQFDRIPANTEALALPVLLRSQTSRRSHS